MKKIILILLFSLSLSGCYISSKAYIPGTDIVCNRYFEENCGLWMTDCSNGKQYKCQVNVQVETKF